MSLKNDDKTSTGIITITATITFNGASAVDSNVITSLHMVSAMETM